MLKAATAELNDETRRIVELGCGGGWITNQLISKYGTENLRYLLSDISEEAIDEASKSLIPPLFSEDLKVGDGFTPWVGQKFDLIINDIAGIADEIAIASDWYNGVPFSAGADGLLNTRKVLSELHSYLNPNGVFVAPVISLSNVTEYRELLAETFNVVIYDFKTLWPLPESLSCQRALLRKLEEEKKIVLEEKYGKLLAFTEVCIGKSVKNGRKANEFK